MDKEKTGKLIKELRKKNGLTQLQLAEKLHVSDKAVSKWERGLSLPDIDLLEPLSAELHIRIDELLSGQLDPEPEKPSILYEPCDETDAEYSYLPEPEIPVPESDMPKEHTDFKRRHRRFALFISCIAVFFLIITGFASQYLPNTYCVSLDATVISYEDSVLTVQGNVSNTINHRGVYQIIDNGTIELRRDNANAMSFEQVPDICSLKEGHQIRINCKSTTNLVDQSVLSDVYRITLY